MGDSLDSYNPRRPHPQIAKGSQEEYDFGSPSSTLMTAGLADSTGDFGSAVRGDGAMHEEHRGSFSSLPDGRSPTASPTRGDDGGSKGGDAQNDAPPSWSELKTKAGKERKRLPLACIACRRKKIRCSGEKPACKHCMRSRIPCVYKVTTRKAAPRTDYMAMLDKRLKRMEERVIKVIPKEEQATSGNVPRAVVKPALPPAPQKPSAAKKRGATAAFADELDDWANATAAAIETSEESDGQGAGVSLKNQDLEEQNLLVEGVDKLPSKEVQEHLAEVFFDYVYGQGYHLLHKPSFIRKLAQGTVPPVLMLAVCAISARFSNHPSVRTEPAFLRGEEWASAARDISLRRYDSPNITILIVYLILGLHEFGTCQGGRSWMFGGMAQRMAYALQLHKDLDHEPKTRYTGEKTELTFTDREIRRRTMWSCFLMDRFNSSGTDRPIFIGEQYIRAQLPIKESFYQMEITGPTEDLEGNVPNPVDPNTGQMSSPRDNMGVAAYQIRLIAIWGKLVHYFNLGGKERETHPMWEKPSIFQSLCRAVKDWRDTLPASLQYTPENLQNHASEKIANQFLFLHISYNQARLFLHRFALPAPGCPSAFTKGMPQAFLAESTRSAHDAANQISALVHEGMDRLVVAPFAGYCAFFSSTVHIHGAFSGKPALEASSKQNLARNVKYLGKMKKYWGMFHFVTENLRDLYRKHAEAARTGQKSGAKEGEQGIFQYGDWFDRYPHGVSGTDYEEPNASLKKEPGADAVLGQKSDLQTVEEFFSKLTPPTRAAQLQSQAPAPAQAQRKATKSKRSKSESKPAADAGAQRQATKQAQPQAAQQRSNESPLDDPIPTTFQNSSPTRAAPNAATFAPFPQHSSAFPAGFQAPPNPLLMNEQSNNPLMSQLDRQMVLNSYANMAGPSAANLNSLIDPIRSQGFPGSYDYAAFAGNPGAGGGGAFWPSDPSTTTPFFMPFNLEPPSFAGGGPGAGDPVTGGADAGVFGAGFDWAGFEGFGELNSGGDGTGLIEQDGEAMDGVI